MLGDRVPHSLAGHYVLACEDAVREQIAISKTQRVRGKLVAEKFPSSAAAWRPTTNPSHQLVRSSRTTSATPCVVSA